MRTTYPRTRRQPPRAAFPAAEALEARALLSSSVFALPGGEIIHDPARGLLYVPVGSSVQRFDLSARAVLPPLAGVGTALYRGDITADGSRLLLPDVTVVTDPADPFRRLTFVRDVNLATGAVSTVSFRTSSEGKAYDLAVAANGKALLSVGEDLVGLYELDPSTGAVVHRGDLVGPQEGRPDRYSRLSRSADRGRILVSSPGGSDGSHLVYSSATDSVVGDGHSGTASTPVESISRDGSVVAIHGVVWPDGGAALTDGRFDLLFDTPGAFAASAFAPDGTVLFADHVADEIVAFATAGPWLREKYRLKAGADVVAATNPGNAPISGSMQVSPDGREAWLLNNGNLQVFDLPRPDPTAAAYFAVEGFSPFSPAGYAQSLKVTAYDASGEVARLYRGTVRFRSTDPRADLPADYTFTAADNGVHTFNFSLDTPGTHAVEVADRDNGASASATGMRVHDGNVSVVPLESETRFGVPGVGNEMVWNEARQLLYVANRQFVQRYDPRAGALLAPIRAGRAVYGIDVTPDGRSLYVAEAQEGPRTGTFRRIDLDTGAVERLPFRGIETRTRSASDVAVVNNGKALGTPGTSDFVQEIDPSSGTVRRSDGSGWVDSGSKIATSADGGTAFIWSPDQRIVLYDAATNAYPASRFGDVRGNSHGSPAAVNRDGTRIAHARGDNSLHVLDRNLDTVHTFAGLVVGAAFNPAPGRDELYLSRPGTGGITAYDTSTWAEKYKVLAPAAAAEGPGFYGEMTTNADGTLLFAKAPAGFWPLPLHTRPVISGPDPAASAPGVARTVTVTATTPSGAADPNHRGTVRFTSSDPAAVLPGDYTFTAADAGTRAFDVTFNTPGRHTLTVTDVAAAGARLAYASDAAAALVTGAALAADGTLWVVGTAAGDTVSVARAAGSVTATLNGATRSFDAAGVRRVALDLLGGADDVTLGDGAPGGFADLGDGADALRAAAQPPGSAQGLGVAGGGGADAVTLAAGAGPVRFDGGGDGPDHLTLQGSAGPDAVRLAPHRLSPRPGAPPMAAPAELTRARAAGAFDAFFTALESLSLDAGAGDDSFTGEVRPGLTAVTFDGGAGDDALDWTWGGEANEITLDAASVHDAGNTLRLDHRQTERLDVDAGAGADRFWFLAPTGGRTVRVRGGAGNDEAVVSAPHAITTWFDGGPGADRLSFTGADAAGQVFSVAHGHVTDAARTVYDSAVETIALLGRTFADTFRVVPRPATRVEVDGYWPIGGTPGDRLSVDPAGVTGLRLTRSGSNSGEFTFANRQPVSYRGIEAVDDPPPVVSSARFSRGTQSLELTFSEGLSAASLSGTDLVLTDRATGAAVDASNFAVGYDPATGTARFTFPGLPGGRLPDGTYRATLPAGAVSDAGGAASTAPFSHDFANVPPAVMGRHVFYNNSHFDGRSAQADARDDAAIAPDKTALRPGGSAGFANVSTSAHGINGVMVDILGLPQGQSPSAADFALDVLAGGRWRPVAVSPSVAVRPGAGIGGADRVTLTLPDGAVKNAWLRVTVKATASTGLSSPDVLYFGHLAGETGDSAAGGALTVTPLDFLRTRRAMGAPYDPRHDFNRDGRVSPLDLAIVRAAVAQRRMLALLNAPGAPPPAGAPVPPPASRAKETDAGIGALLE